MRIRNILVLFSSLKELKELAGYYLSCEEERERIASQGQKLVKENHTYLNRVEKILSLCKDRKEAPARTWKQSRVFLQYSEIYSRLVMVDAVCDLFAHQKACFWYKLLALKNVCFAVCKRLRRMNWRIFIKSIFKYDN